MALSIESRTEVTESTEDFLDIDQLVDAVFGLCFTKIKKIAEPRAL
jgi:hypothetical protein